MWKRLGWGWLISLLAGWMCIVTAAAQDGSSNVYQISLEGALTPAMVAYVERGVAAAETDGAQALIVVLNTPGGRLDWMQQIVQALRGSTLPVVVYVAPRGASAASAGTLITLAGHAAAMAPETTIGAASPVDEQGQDVGDTLARKVKEDTRALARGLTAHRSEKATQLAEAMIEEARAVSAPEALAAGLIDFVALDQADLLRQLDGFTVDVAGRPVKLATQAAQVRSIDMTLIEQILSRVADPNVVALLLFIGAQGILIELGSPGGWIPGFVGVVCVALSIYGLGVLPVNWFGLVLFVLALVLFVLDVKSPTHGALTIAGAVTLVAGLLVLFGQPGVEEFGRLSIPMIVGLSVGMALFFGFIVAKGIGAQRAQPVTGLEGLVGAIGVARSELAPQGLVFVQGERWRAVADEGSLASGTPVQVVGVDGFVLKVRRAQNN